MLDFDIGVIPETEEKKEDARRQRIANLTDLYPSLADLMNGLTWNEIYQLSMVRQRS